MANKKKIFEAATVAVAEKSLTRCELCLGKVINGQHEGGVCGFARLLDSLEKSGHEIIIRA